MKKALILLIMLAVIVILRQADAYINRSAQSDLTAWEIMDFLRQFGYDHPGVRHFYVISNQVAVYLEDDSRRQINSFRRQVIDSPLITFRSAGYLPSAELSAPLQINPVLENLVSMEVTTVNKEQNLVVATMFNGSDYDLFIGGNRIEFFDGEDWWRIPVRTYTIIFYEGGRPIPAPGSFTERTFNLDAVVGPIKPGLYRMRQSVAVRPPPTPTLPRWPQWTSDIIYNHDIVAEFYWE